MNVCHLTSLIDLPSLVLDKILSYLGNRDLIRWDESNTIHTE